MNKRLKYFILFVIIQFVLSILLLILLKGIIGEIFVGIFIGKTLFFGYLFGYILVSKKKRVALSKKREVKKIIDKDPYLGFRTLFGGKANEK